jgi:hypothetical protein
MPSPMMSLMGIRGLSDPTGSWKMICIRRRSCLSSRPFFSKIFWPPSVAEPEVGGWSWIRVLPRVDLPQPDSPTSPKTSPAYASNETSSTAFTSPILRRRMPPRIG